MRQAQHLRFVDRPDLQQAEALLARAIAIQPDYLGAYVQLTFTRLDQEFTSFYALDGTSETTAVRWTRIEEPLETARAIDPHDPDVNILSGLIARLRNHDLKSAVHYYQRAIDASPGNYELDYLPVLLDLNQIDEAVEYGEYLAISSPLCTPCLHVLARAYLLAGRPDRAERATAQARMLQPGSRNGQEGEIQLYRGNPASALALFDALDLDDPDRAWGRAIALHRLGRDEESEAEFEGFRSRWGRKMPDTVAYIYAKLGNPDAAFEWLDRLDRYIASHGEATFNDFYWSELVADPRWRRFQEKWGVAPAQLARYPLNIRIPMQNRTSDPFP